MNYILKYLILFLILTFCSSIKVMAQEKMDDVIYLKNGGVYKGNIIEVVPNQHIKIEIVGGNVIIIPFDEVSRTAKEAASTEKADYRIKPRGYYGLLSPGLSFGQSFSYYGSNLNLSFHIVNGYRFNRFLSAGLGMGIEGFSHLTLLPVFLETRGFVLDRPATPFYFAGVGYSSAVLAVQSTNHTTTGGVFFKAGLGVRAPIGAHNSFFASLGYRYQEASVFQQWEDWRGVGSVETNYYFRRIVLNFGFLF